MLYTRKDYISGGKCSHREYYSQFVTERQRTLTAEGIGIDRLLNSKDEDFNDIPLSVWDSLPHDVSIMLTAKNAGETLTQAVCVCIQKEAARQIVERVKGKPSLYGMWR